MFFSCSVIFSLKIKIINQIINMSRKKSENVFQKNIFRLISFFIINQVQDQNHIINYIINIRRREFEDFFHKISVKNILRLSLELSFILFSVKLNLTDFNQS